MAGSSTGWYFTSEFSRKSVETLYSRLKGFNSFSVMSTDYVQISFKLLEKVTRNVRKNICIDFSMDFLRDFFIYNLIYLFNSCSTFWPIFQKAPHLNIFMNTYDQAIMVTMVIFLNGHYGTSQNGHKNGHIGCFLAKM